MARSHDPVFGMSGQTASERAKKSIKPLLDEAGVKALKEWLTRTLPTMQTQNVRNAVQSFNPDDRQQNFTRDFAWTTRTTHDPTIAIYYTMLDKIGGKLDIRKLVLQSSLGHPEIDLGKGITFKIGKHTNSGVHVNMMMPSETYMELANAWDINPSSKLAPADLTAWQLRHQRSGQASETPSR